LPLSFIGAKRLLTTFADQLRRTPDDQVHTLIATVLTSIATLQLPHRPIGSSHAPGNDALKTFRC
jgi:hypothetical protein